MEKITQLNVRVYGLLFKENKLLFLREKYGERELFKLPGGGLELGEGTKQTLEREFFEELNIKIEVIAHVYTQDIFVPSQLTPRDQLLAIYYKVDCKDCSTLKIKEEKIKGIDWVPVLELPQLTRLLPIDKIVIDKLMND